MLIDTNLIIYAVQPDRGGLRRWITSSLTIHQPSVITFEEAIRLRRQRRMSLGDALIAATALEHRQPLATANVADFQWIDNLTLVNPLA